MAQEKKTLEVTHVNIRQSISFLLLKLIVIDLLAAIFVIIFFSAIFASQLTIEFKTEVVSFNQIYFALLFVFKTFLTLFVVLQWLNEYYEIRPDRIIHRKGVIWRHEYIHEFSDIKSLKFRQGIFGRIFNYGSLSFFDWKEDKHKSIYLIHNPQRYFKILQDLVPRAEVEKETIREKMFEEDE